MDDIGKEEGKSMEEGQGNKSLSQTHVHAQLEEGHEPNPNPVDSVELETQKSIHENGVELSSDIEEPVDSAPAVVKTPEEANIAANPANELHTSTETDKLGSNVDSGLHCESEVYGEIESEEHDGEKGGALKDEMGSKVNPSIELCASAETGNVVDDGESHHTEVSMEIEKEDVGGGEEKSLKDGVSSKVNSNEQDISAETDKLGSNVDSGMHCESEVSMKIQSEENDWEEREALKGEVGSRVNPSSAETDNVVGDGESRHTEVPMEIEKEDVGGEEGKSLKGGVSSKVNSSNEQDISVETDKLGSNVDSGMHCESEVSVKIQSEENDCEEREALKGEIGSRVNPSSAETDNVVGDGESRHTEVPMEIEKEAVGGEEEKSLKDGVSSKVNSSNEQDISAETDKLGSNVDSGMHCESEVSVKIRSEENDCEEMEALKGEIGSRVNPSSAETDNVVGDGESRHTEVPMEIEKGDDGVEEEKSLKDLASSKINPSHELVTSAETDNVACKAELDMPYDSEVAMEKLIRGVTSEVNPSSETHIRAEPDNVIAKVEPGMPCDGEVATQKLIDGVSNKAKPSTEPDSNAETNNVVCKVEPDMSRDIEVAEEKLIDGVSSEASPSSEPHISDETDNAVCKVDPDMPCDSEVATGTLIDVVSSEANPSNEPHISAETDNVVCEVEPDKMRRRGGVSAEKLIDGLESKAHPSNEPRISLDTDKVVSKVKPNIPHDNEVEMETESDDDGLKGEALKGGMSSKTNLSLSTNINEQFSKPKFYVGRKAGMKSLNPKKSIFLGPGAAMDDDSGTEEEQAAFQKEVENLYKDNNLEFKPPKFYREEVNLLKLWRAVIKLGGYEKVTSCKLWRQVGESFNPPKTCTTVSWTFRNFYEKALLEFEKHKLHGGELSLPAEPTRVENRADGSQTLGSGRALRDAAARAMQGWHSQRLFGNGEVGDPIIKDKHLNTMLKSDKQLKTSGLLKRKKPSHVDCGVQAADMKSMKPRLDTMVFDIGPPADWVKINVKRFNDCFEVYALVPGLLREEVHVQSDPAGRLIITGQPTQLDNPWGVTPFKKVVSLPARIDPHQTSAVVTLNGQLFVRVPLEQSDF